MISFREFLELKEGMYHGDSSGVHAKVPKPSDWQGSTTRQPGGSGKTPIPTSGIAASAGGTATPPSAGGLGGMSPPNGGKMPLGKMKSK